jgi:hypothetical protein
MNLARVLILKRNRAILPEFTFTNTTIALPLHRSCGSKAAPVRIRVPSSSQSVILIRNVWENGGILPYEEKLRVTTSTINHYTAFINICQIILSANPINLPNSVVEYTLGKRGF